MVAIFTGPRTGLEQGSASVLGNGGLIGAANQGRGGEQVFVNAATGNLLVSRGDEYLIGVGPDVAVTRTYNSLDDQSDDNRDNWRLSTQRRLTLLPGAVNAPGSTITKIAEDGSRHRYTFNSATGFYETTDGAGAHDRIQNIGHWRWTDGDSGHIEDYDTSGNLITVYSPDGTSVGYEYEYHIDRYRVIAVRTSDGSAVHHVWSANNNIVELRTSFTDLVSSVAKQLTRTRYGYDAQNRLATVTTDLSPDDNVIADGRTYVTSYSYVGDSRLIASITQTDGSRLDIGYDASQRVISLGQSAGGGEVRTTQLAYGVNFTNVTDPAGNLTRLDYEGGSVVPGLAAWGFGGVTRQAATIDGRAAFKYTVSPGSTWSGISQGFPVQAGDTATLSVTLQADGASTPQILGLRSSALGWGDLNISSARIVAGPGTISKHSGGLWRVDGLSTTAGTRIEITHVATQADSFGAYLYVDHLNGIRPGQSLIAGDAEVTVSPDRTESAMLDFNNWYGDGYAKQPAGTIHGGAAYRLTPNVTGSWTAIAKSLVAKNQDMFSWSFSLQAVGDTTTQDFGLYGDVSAWGANAASSARIISGPGTLSQLVGGIWRVTGLSATIPTRIEVIRTYAQDETGGAYLYVDNLGGFRASTSLIVAAPKLTRIAEETAPNYRLTRITAPPASAGQPAQLVQFGYDRDNNLTRVTDAAGRATNYQYDASGNLTLITDPNGHTTERWYDGANNLIMERVWGSSTLHADEALYTRYVYDGERHLRYVISAEGSVAEHRYDSTGFRIETIEYPKHPYPLGTSILTEVGMNAWRNGLADRSTIKGTYQRYDGRGNLAQIFAYGAHSASSGGSVADGYIHDYYTYDQAGRLLNSRTATRETEHYAYDGLGRLITTTDLNGGTTTIAFDDAATRTVITSARGLVITQTYNKAGDLISTLDAGNYDHVSGESYKYDRLGRVRMATDGVGANRYTLYDKAGRKTGDIDHHGGLIEYRYDAADRLVARIAYNNRLSAAQIAALADPNHAQTVEGLRPAHQAGDLWNWTIHDAEGRVIGAVDGSGMMVAYEYDRSDRLIRTITYQNKLSAATLASFRTAAPANLAAFGGPGVHSRSFHDRAGRLVGALDGEGFLTESVHDAAGQLVEQIAYKYATDPARREAGSLEHLRSSLDPGSAVHNRSRFVYNGQGKLRFAIDAAGHVTEYNYVHGVQWSAVEGPRKTTRYAAAIGSLGAYTVASVSAAVAGQVGAAANRVDIAVYDTRGRVVYTIDAAGSVTGFVHDQEGHVVRSTRYAQLRTDQAVFTDAEMNSWASANATDARVTRHWYTASGDLRYTTDAENYVTRYDYDHERRLTAVYKWDNRVPNHDALTIGDIDHYSSASGAHTQSVYHQYDATGVVVRSHDALSFQTLYSYNANGTLNGIQRAYGTVDESATLWTYDGAGRVALEYRAYGAPEQAILRYEHDGYGNLIATTDALDRVTHHSYDRVGRVVTTTDPAGGITRFEYDALGNVVRTIDPRGHSTYHYYDSHGRIVASRDAENYITETSYNAFGEVATVTRRHNRSTTTASTTAALGVTPHASDATTQFFYDKAGRVVRTVDANNVPETFSYNATGDRTSVTSRINGTTDYRYDRRGQLVFQNVQRNDYGNADSWTATTFAYDARGNRTRMTEADGLPEARTTTYTFDRADRLTATQLPAIMVFEAASGANVLTTPVETVRYDARGNVTETADAAGARTLYFYDDLNRVTVQMDALGAYSRFTYDRNGNLLSSRAYAQTIGHPVDGGAAAEAPAPPAGEYRETSFVYDGLNRMTSSTVAGVRTGYWNGSSYVAAATSITTSYEYDASGNVVRTIDPNLHIGWSYYDKLGRKVQQVDAEGYRTDWDYDAEGNVRWERRFINRAAAASSTTAPPPVTHDDAFDRITYFLYDKVGNRTLEQRVNVLVHDGSGNHVNTHATISYSYNGLGQVLSKSEATGDQVHYEYDRSGRLISERRPGFMASHDATVTPVVHYGYDGLDNLKQTIQLGAGTAAARTTNYTYGPGGQLASMTDASNYTTTYQYDIMGRQRRAWSDRQRADTAAIHHSDFTTYDLLGRIIQRQSATYEGGWSWGDVAYTRYNGFGDVAAIRINNDVAEQLNHYDSAGRLLATNSGDGVWKYFGYDAAGYQTVAITSAGYGLAGLSFDGALALASRSDVNATFTVHDKRGMAVQVVEDGRELAQNAALEQLVTQRAYNAFGEVASETNALGAVISYHYNNMGRLIRTESPFVTVLNADGSASYNVRPTEHRFYDAAGRLTGSRDANANLTRLTLLAGSGYGGAQALATHEHHADSGVKQSRYDIHGDLRTVIDEIGRVDTLRYDGMGRVIEVAHSGGLIDSYGHDGLGQQIWHYNNLYGASDKDTTRYDMQGRVIATRAIGGDTTSSVFQWQSGLSSTVGQYGGWQQVTTLANGKSTTDRSDLFGRELYKSDLGNNVTSHVYDAAGRLSRSTTNGLATDYGYFNTGLVATVFSGAPAVANSNWTNHQATYRYDRLGQKREERLVLNQGVYSSGDVIWNGYGWEYTDPYYYQTSTQLKNATANYDALGRLTQWAEAGTPTAPAANIIHDYDANGNIRATRSTFYSLDKNGGAINQQSRTHWFRFDAMNRVVTDRGTLRNGQIVRGDASWNGQGGKDIQYNLAGERVASIETAYTPGEYIPEWNFAYPGTFHEARESYSYDLAGRLATVHRTAGSAVAESYDPVTGQPIASGSLPAAPPPQPGAAPIAAYGYDLVGRQTSQTDYGYAGGPAVFSRSASYNARGQLTSDDVSTKKGDGYTYRSVTSYDYGAGSAYALGAVVSQSSSNYRNNVYQSASSTSNAYGWRDGAVQTLITHRPNTAQSTTHTTSFSYDAAGRLLSAWVQDGRPHGVTFTSDELGQVIRRDAGATSTAQGSPHEAWYRFNGRQMGYSGNNGTEDLNYAGSVAQRQQVAPATPGAFRNGQTYSAPHADFTQSLDPINSLAQGSAAGGYAARAGDTLASIAATLWGDASLWWKLAEANGLQGDARLNDGQRLTIPAGVMKSHHNAATFTPYDPADAIGDVSPTTPKPAKGKNKCGAFGAILLIIVAVAVVAILAGPASGAFTTLFTGSAAAGTAAATAAATAGAIAGGAAAGAAGSIVSQAVGLATGIQEKFSWKGVALAAIAGGIGGGLSDLLPAGAIGGSKLVTDVARGALGNAATQGVAVATGLQKKFDWAGVAIGGVVAGALGAANRGLAHRGLGVATAKINGATSRNAAFYANQALSGAAGAIAGAATRSAIDGSSFGDNVLAALPDVIGSTVGNLLGGAVAERETSFQRLKRAGGVFLASTEVPAEWVVTATKAQVDAAKRGSWIDRLANQNLITAITFSISRQLDRSGYRAPAQHIRAIGTYNAAAYRAVGNSIAGTIHAITHPRQTLFGLAASIDRVAMSNPSDVVNAVRSGYRRFSSASLDGKAEMLGNATGNIAFAAVTGPAVELAVIRIGAAASSRIGALAGDGFSPVSDIASNPRFINSFTPPADLVPGTVLFGNHAHTMAVEAFKSLNRGVEVIDRTGPGQRGIDLSLTADHDMLRLGFEHIEIKPNTASGLATFNRQMDRWGYDPSTVRAITYDPSGNIFWGFD